jgi:hypothetical protein
VGVIGGIGTLAVFGWRLNDRVGDYLRDNSDTVFTDRWGLYLAGGGLIVALVALLVPKERPAAA